MCKLLLPLERSVSLMVMGALSRALASAQALAAAAALGRRTKTSREGDL